MLLCTLSGSDSAGVLRFLLARSNVTLGRSSMNPAKDFRIEITGRNTLTIKLERKDRIGNIYRNWMPW